MNTLSSLLKFIGNHISVDYMYPVGSYYETSDTGFNPNTAWGGTWVQDSVGRVTVAQDTNDTAFATVSGTGGSKYIQAHTHSHSNPSVAGNGTHTHNIHIASPSNTGTLSTDQLQYGRPSGSAYTNDNSVRSSGWHTHTLSGGGVGGVNNVTTGTSGNLQPYIVVVRWHRTA